MFAFLISERTEAAIHSQQGISIVLPNGSVHYRKVVTTIKKKLKLIRNKETINTLYLSNPNAYKVNLDKKKLVILVGSSALDFYTHTNAKSPYITTLITQSAFNYFYSKSKYKNNFVGGVMIDQPTKRYKALAKALLPSLNKAGLVIGPEKAKQKKSLLNSNNNADVNYNLVEISLNDNPVKMLRSAYESNQALIVLPDRKKFNRSLSRWILTLSYQYKIPVISYSKKYVEAGALASLFSTAENIGNQTAEMVISFLSNPSNKVKKLMIPKYFDIDVNKSVAKALNIKTPSKLAILKKIPN